MKKILLISVLNLLFHNISFAENYYFKQCKINEIISADYIINFDKNVIQVNLNNLQEKVTQSIEDEIKLVTDEQITSKIIPSGKGDENYFQYYLNAKSNSVIKQTYKKVGDIFRLSGKRDTPCADVKVDWDKIKIEEEYANKQQKEALKTQQKISEEQSTLAKCNGSNSKEWENCQGTYTNENESTYTGLFQNGQIIKGIVKFPGGGTYTGSFQFEKPNGQGTFTYSNGTIHSGQWKNGKGHGQGIKTWNNGAKYEGEFKNDKMDGQGTFSYSDNSKYIGEFKDGKKHGQGTLIYPDGKRFIGQFVIGTEHGKGVCVNIDGVSMNCKNLKAKNLESVEASKNRRDISIEAKKWIKINDYESASGKGKKVIDKLENDFVKIAIKLCSPKDSFDVLEKNIDVLEIDETPAFGTTPAVKLAITGVVECK